MSSVSRLPVLIVGGGPTGLISALTLSKNGVPVRIIQKDDEFHVGQRGSGVQPRTLEVYKFLDVYSNIKEGGNALQPIRTYKMPGGVEPLRTAYIVPPEESTPATPFVNSWMIGQAHAEEIFRSQLAKYGVHVELSTELRRLEQHEDHVTAKIVKRCDGQEIEEMVECDWLIGADGGRGVTRKLLGLTFLGEALTAEMIFGEVNIDGLDRDHLHIWGDPSSVALFLRPTEYPRIFTYVIIGKDVDYKRIYESEEDLKAALKKACGDRKDLVFGEIVWKSNYRPSARMVNKFQKGRVFVAGDAAHVHSPTGGQGLNSSVQDAFNLGWKLALVHKDLASPSLLKTYEEERLPVIHAMLEKTTNIFNQTFSASASGRFGEAWANTPGLRMLGVNYRWSSIVIDSRALPTTDQNRARALDAYGVERGEVVCAGDRAPDAPGLLPVAAAQTTSLFDIFKATYHTVLIFSVDPVQITSFLNVLQAYPKDLVRSLAIYPLTTQNPTTVPGTDLTLLDQAGHAYQGYSITYDKPTVITVRPDGVIGAIAFGQDGLQTYFKRVFSNVGASQ